MLITTVSISAITQIALVYVPVMQSVFQTEGLRMGDLGVILGLAATSMCSHECRRRWERKGIEESERWGRVGEMV